MLEKNNKFYIIIEIVVGSIVGFINGFFGGGAGMLIVPFYVYILKLEDKKAHATTLFSVLPLSLVSAIVYLVKSPITNISLFFKVGIGFVIGGIIGALLLKKVNNKVLRIIFSLIMIFCGIIQILK